MENDLETDRKEGPMKKILISGMYGADNLGDDYILMSITDTT